MAIGCSFAFSSLTRLSSATHSSSGARAGELDSLWNVLSLGLPDLLGRVPEPLQRARLAREAYATKFLDCK